MNEIEVIWKFLDNLDEYVYATDIETDELVYMNRKLLEVYGCLLYTSDAADEP